MYRLSNKTRYKFNMHYKKKPLLFILIKNRVIKMNIHQNGD
ncbi:hypothetical protein PROVRUST_08111 [Providencia rustigianii DSM 4541]|uniref:Uncharacterized protein n=1 Tax=Providencia rustigianii DSM 4541 TaxID=500637 RepID=D1P790_9GAMM|nr:hypothetical protein PROVRUST_08111 [Providencia rustigianii DSM 4541]